MADFLQQLLTWVNAHPVWAQLVLFAVAFLEAVFVIGAFVPAAPLLFAFGALIALGTLELWPTVLVSTVGTLVGGVLSFWLGRVYGDRLFETPALRRYADSVRNGRIFFEKHGGKSVLLTRFLGPLRAVTPAIAGAAHMKLWLFVVVDGFASFIWSLAYLMPGVVFGASLGLAAEVAGRLAVLLLALVVLSWLAVWLTLELNRQMQKHAEQWLGALLDWSRRHRRLGVFGAALADRDQPETPVLAAVAALLLTLGSGALLLVWGIGPDEAPPGMDLRVFQTLQSVQEPAATWLAIYGSLLGEWPVYLPYFASVLVLLLLQQQRRAAAHWVAALLFGGAITLGLGLVPDVSNPREYRGLIERAYFPHDLVMSVVIYGFTPVLLGGGRRLYYGAAALLLSIIVFARLYLGSLWLSVELIALASGILWVAALGLGYHRHQRRERPVLRQLLPALLVFLLAAGWHWRHAADARALLHAPSPELSGLASAQWWTADWEQLPGRRQDMAGRDKQYLNLQWAGDLAEIESLLLARGWELPQPLSVGNSLRWLSPEAEIGELPLLPRTHAGQHQVLTLRRGMDAQHQLLLRLWPSEFQLDGSAPLWIGTLVVQETRPVARLFRYPINGDIFTLALDALELPLPGFEARRVQRDGATYTTLLLRPSAAD